MDEQPVNPSEERYFRGAVTMRVIDSKSRSPSPNNNNVTENKLEKGEENNSENDIKERKLSSD